MTLAASDPKITAFLGAWHEAERAAFRSWDHLDYDSYEPKSAKERRRFIALDKGKAHQTRGVYLVDRVTKEVYSIKAYGVPNRPLGSIEAMTTKFLAAGELGGEKR